MGLAFGIAALVAINWLPGWLWLRRSGMDAPTRAVAAIPPSFGATNAVFLALVAFGVFTQLTAALTVVAITGLAIVWPFPPGAIELPGGAARQLRGPLIGAGVVGGWILVQAVRAAVFRLSDAVAFWAPIAREIGDTGSVDTSWFPTVIEGYPWSVGFVAGSTSVLLGGFDEVHAFLVHPLFATVLLATVVLLAGYVGGRRSAWVALLTMLATPLIARGVFFHDDLVMAFFGTIAVLLALRVATPAGWALVGLAAGSALAIKHLGAVAFLLAASVMVARRSRWQSWAYAAAGSLVGLPIYIWNVVKYGNPIHPLMNRLFGGSSDLNLVYEDWSASLEAADRGTIPEIGVFAVLVTVAGVAAWLLRALRNRSVQAELPIVALLAASLVYLVVWRRSPYASRHVLAVYPVLAAIAGAGLGRDTSHSEAPATVTTREWMVRMMPVLLVAAGLITLTAWSIQRDAGGGEPPDVAYHTGVYTLTLGKYPDIHTFLKPPEDPLELWPARSRQAWEILSTADPDLLVLSFDRRTYYLPQRVLVANDVDALPIYASPEIEDQHAAMKDLGIGFVVHRPQLAAIHPIADRGPWHLLEQRPNLFTPLLSSGSYQLYEVRDTPDQPSAEPTP